MSMTLDELPAVAECSVAGCSYNDHSHCHAAAVTIGGSVGDAECATFIPLGTKGGLDKVVTHAGRRRRRRLPDLRARLSPTSAVRV